MATLESKKQTVEEIAERLRESQTTVLVDYRGLDVAEVTELRQSLRDAGVEYKVYKNTLSRRAAAEADLEELNDTLIGPTAIAFSKDDVIAPARVLHDFSKQHEELEIKGGVIEGEIATIEQLKELASLPDHEGMLSMLLNVLQAPIRNFAYATKAIAEKDEEQDESEEQDE